MFFAHDWIKQYLPQDIDLETVARLLNETGLETEVEGQGVEVEHTVNRPDAMCHFGIARELSIKLGVSVQEPPVYEGPIESLGEWQVESAEPSGCHRYIGVLIENVVASQSPAWLQQRLESIEQTSHNLLVDLTNFLLWEFGHPSHAFDADRIPSQRILVRLGQAGESLTTLDGRQHQAAGHLCISDGETPIAFAGVMGGQSTEVQAGTTRLLLELGCFDPVAVRRTGRACNINSDARHRFERGVDEERMSRVVRRFIYLLQKEQPEIRLRGSVDMNLRPFQRQNLTLRERRLQQLLGIQIPRDEVSALLTRMDFQPQWNSDHWQVSCPGYKVDVTREVDVIEEIIRFAGLHRLTSELPKMAGSDFDEGSIASYEYTLVEKLKQIGLQEVRTYSFLIEGLESRFVEGGVPVRLRNPMSDSQAVMRRMILPNVVDALARNARHGVKQAQFFETGHVYTSEGEPHHLAIAVMHRDESDGWWDKSSHHPLFLLKGFVETLSEVMGWQQLEFEACDVGFLKPGEGLRLRVDGLDVGHLGMLHRAIRDELDLEVDVAVFECQLDRLRELGRRRSPFVAVPQFPSIQMDVAFVVASDIPYAALKDCIVGMELSDLEQFELFDIYTGKALPKGSKSLGFRFRFRSGERTLTQTEVNQSVTRMIDALATQFNAVVRK